MRAFRVLAVDDDPDILEAVRFSLGAEGLEVHTATNGWEALGAVRAMAPDVMILDVMLPRENGYRVAKMVKEDASKGRIPADIPIILLTARNLRASPEREKTFMDFSHADAVIYKPFDMAELLKAVKGLLAGRGAAG